MTAKNKIFNRILSDRKGHYCHAIEVNNTYEIESIIEATIQGFQDEYTEKDYIEFFESITIYYLGEDETEENEVYNFSCTEYIAGTID